MSEQTSKPYISMAELMTGYAILGSIDTKAPDILAGNYDHILHCCSYHQKHSTLPENDEQVYGDEDVKEHVNALKRHIRYHLEQAIRQVEKQVEAEANAQFLEKDKPAPEGTVSELAEQFNLSKKKIRKMKRDGELYKLFENNEEN